MGQVDELEALRKQAREALMQGAQSGKLQAGGAGFFGRTRASFAERFI